LTDRLLYSNFIRRWARRLTVSDLRQQNENCGDTWIRDETYEARLS
jgi:hypothetical protein